MRSDESIRNNVMRHLDWNSTVDASDIEVQVERGVVELNGTVPSHRAKRAAAEAAETVKGVKGVSNRLEIRLPDTIVIPEDQKIQENVEGTIAWDPDLDETNIRISFRDRTIKLAGSVDAVWKKDYVEQLASNVPGVVNVENELTIVPTKDIRDETISVDIVAALKRNRLVGEESVDIEVVDGNVILGGKVSSPAAEAAIYHTALYTAGVVDVENQLQVGG